MNRKSFSGVIAIFLTITVFVPSTFLVMPQKAEAQWAVIDLPVGISTALTAIQATLTQVSAATSAIANVAGYVNTYVLQPLAFVLSGNLMKMLTASVVKFVSGQSNGTGAPQFTTNLAKTLQTLSDMKVRAYLGQMNLTGSPFASSISAALNKNYVQGSSLGGFWAANKCTLSNSSTNVPAFLAGNWSQGGVGAWFALTTQSQNNPYMLYQNSQAQLANVVGSAVAARISEISWGSGFMSWCSVSDTSTQKQAGASTAMDACIANGGTPAYCDKVFANAGGAVGGINPGDPCTNANGTSGVIQTPGSTIKATLDKVLGGQQDKLVQMGNIAGQITGILGNIGTVLNTINLASSILGGSGSTGGLLNAGQPSGALSTFAAPTPSNVTSGGYFGVSNTQINQAAASSTVIGSASSGIIARVNMYKTGWDTIGTAANKAKTSLTSLINTCTTNANAATAMLPSANYNYKPILQAFIPVATAQAADAQSALTTEVNPIITKASNAIPIVTAILAMNDKVQKEIGTSAYAVDMNILSSMPPSSDDAAYAAQNANVYNMATSSPPGSLVVPSTSSTIVDQMNLINTNATALTVSCAIPTDPGTGGVGM